MYTNESIASGMEFLFLSGALIFALVASLMYWDLVLNRKGGTVGGILAALVAILLTIAGASIGALV